MATPEASMRAFVAIDPGEKVRAALAELTGRLQRKVTGVSWVRSENFHLTLCFLGEVDPEVVDRIAEILKGPLSEIEPFALGVSGVGAFPNLRRASVLWAGIDEAPGALFDVQSEIVAAARSVGLEVEDRAFSPHITLGRIRRPDNAWGEAFEAEADYDGGAFPVRVVSLFSSKLSPQGAVHRNLQDIRLKWTRTSMSG